MKPLLISFPLHSRLFPPASFFSPLSASSMRIYLRHSVSTDRIFPPISTLARLSAFIDAHRFPPFGLDRAPISALINRAPIPLL
jgi:hypothetical protein